jgi:hypothetical protein
MMDLERITPEIGPDDQTPIDGLDRNGAARWVTSLLRSGKCPPDWAFDRHLPSEFRAVSSQFWTPLEVALCAARWLEREGVRTVVDIGAGIGKFCIATALVGRCTFTGLEQRPRLVSVAQRLARAFECSDRVHFVQAEFGSDPVPPADLYYLYNSFGENLFGPEHCLDQDVELSERRYSRDLQAMDDLLRRAPRGTHLLTYNGFGGTVPGGYCELRTSRELPNVLRLWKKDA